MARLAPSFGPQDDCVGISRQAAERPRTLEEAVVMTIKSKLAKAAVAGGLALGLVGVGAGVVSAQPGEDQQPGHGQQQNQVQQQNQGHDQ
jgi:hypothetical protein